MKTEERIGRVMLAYDKRFKLFMKQELARVPLNAAEGMVLLALYGHDGQTQEEILTEIHRESCGKTQEQLVSELHYDKSVMARTMQSLEGKGYIHREANPKDGRSYLFYLTETARAFQPNMMKILNRWCEKTYQGISKEELASMLKTLEKIAVNMREEEW